MALQAVKLIHVVGSETSSALDFSSSRVQLNATTSAVEMVAVINFTTETQRSSIDESMALLTRILSDLRSFDACIATVTECSVIVANETGICQLLSTKLTPEAFRMPTGLHGFDDTPNNDVTTLIAKRCVQDPEILFTVLASLELVENSILERTEALRAATKDITFNFMY